MVRRSPAESRPPAGFELAYQTEHYDVWRRRSAPGTLVGRLPLGTDLDAGDVPKCSDVARLARAAGEGGELVAARVGTPIAVEFPQDSLPPGWTEHNPYAFTPDGSGSFSEELTTPGGEYELWLEGAVFGEVKLSIDGREVGSERARIGNVGEYEPLGRVRLPAGTHRLEVEYEGASLWPGSAVQPWEIGALVLEAPEQGDLGTVTVSPGDYRQLCGRRWDWVEAYSRE